jgi:hypothetical protein
MKLVLIIATVMSYNYVKFQSSTSNGYREKVNFKKKLNEMLMPARLLNNTPQSNSLGFLKKTWLKLGEG